MPLVFRCCAEDEDESMYVNWWDNPTNPDLWHKHQVFYTSFSSSSGCTSLKLLSSMEQLTLWPLQASPG